MKYGEYIEFPKANGRKGKMHRIIIRKDSRRVTSADKNKPLPQRRAWATRFYKRVRGECLTHPSFSQERD